jgi:hypothetical protein
MTETDRPAFYALESGGWRDYWSLLHPPYTLWHLSYVVIGASVAPEVNVRWLLETLGAFLLAMGFAAHALDELNGRPLKTKISDGVLKAIAMLSFPASDFKIDYRDVEAQKRLLREQMTGFGWWTPRILAHLDDAPDFYLDQVAQVVMQRWSKGRVGLLGDAAFSASPMSGAGTGLALVGAYVLAGELAAAGWDPAVGFAGYERRMRDYVDANQEIGRMHVQMLVPDPDAPPSAEPDMAAITALIERAVNGPELPDYEGVPDSGTTATVTTASG